MSISAIIKTIQDIMRMDAGVDGDAQRISQLVWMLFLKIFDDREHKYELIEENYVSPIPESLRWRNWANDLDGITGNELLDFVNDDLFKTLKNLPFSDDSDPRGFVVREVFEDSYNYMKNGTLIRQVVNKINEINFKDSKDRHIFGDVYEKILKNLQSAGNAGEFYTPRAVTEFMVQMVNPKIGEKILDPACGTGGFLTSSIEHLKKKVESDEDCQILQKSIHGVEKKPLPHLLCVTNMMLHGIEVPSQIHRDNSLARPLRDYKSADKMDVIITNPPFGGIEENGIETGFPPVYQTRETADLFLVLIIHLLKDNGRGAIVLPDGTLFGEGVKTRIKEKLLNDCNLHTIVRLPNGVFNPYTGIKTNLLFFTKGKPTNEIWYYEHPYPDGYKSYSKTKPMEIQEFEPEKAWWNKRKENKFAWKVSIDDIKANNYNLDIKNPHKEVINHGDPRELLENYKVLLSETSKIRTSLKNELMDALAGKNLMNPDIFFKNFELLADAPNWVQKLRELILQFAVMGKLVPQDPNDKLVNVLSKKSAKSLKPVPKNEIPFDSPRGWIFTYMDQVSNAIHYGYTASANNSLTDVRLLRITDIQNNKVNWETVPGCEINAQKLNSYALNNNDLLIARTGGTIGKSYLVENLSTKAVFASYLIRIVPNGLILPKYLKLYADSPLYWNQLYSKCAGTGQPNVNATSLKSLIIPLPHLEEQKRIVEKVDALMNLCNQLEEKIGDCQKNAETLMDAFLIEAVRGYK